MSIGGIFKLTMGSGFCGLRLGGLRLCGFNAEAQRSQRDAELGFWVLGSWLLVVGCWFLVLG